MVFAIRRGVAREIGTDYAGRHLTSSNLNPAPATEAVRVRARALYELRQSVKRCNAGASILGAVEVFMFVKSNYGPFGSTRKKQLVDQSCELRHTAPATLLLRHNPRHIFEGGC